MKIPTPAMMTATVRMMTMAPNVGCSSSSAFAIPHSTLFMSSMTPSSSAAMANVMGCSRAGATSTQLGVASLSDPDHEDYSSARTEQEASYDFPSSSAVRFTPKPTKDLPTLYNIPEGLSPSFQPLGRLSQMALWLVSTLVATTASISWNGIIPRLSIGFHVIRAQIGYAMEHKARLHIHILVILRYIVKAFVLAWTARAAIQELFELTPSRISVADLKRHYFLPSILSKYERIPVPGVSDDIVNGERPLLGVHYLKYVTAPKGSDKENDEDQPKYGAIYFNHGFGANSLSWLPAIPAVVDLLQGQVGLAHDTVGFGLTDRSTTSSNSSSRAQFEAAPEGTEEEEELYLYRPRISSAIGLELIEQSVDTSMPVAIFGHSMGCITTLHMALGLPRNIPKTIILVAPALGFSRSHTDNEEDGSTDTEALDAGYIKKKPRRFSIGRYAGRVAIPVLSYVLRQVVGQAGFWRKGLSRCWHNPKEFLSESSVTAFTWPSVVKGWEQGVLNFAKAASKKSALSDAELMEQVLQLPNTNVHVIYSDDDPVIPAKHVQSFFKDFESRPNLEVVSIGGVGHDPFEENTEGFVDLLNDVLLERGNM